MKETVLCVSFGTALKEGCADLKAVEWALRSVVSDRYFVHALTSEAICKRLLAQGKAAESLSRALERLAAQGFQRVAVQPTHLFYGTEYDTMKSEIERWKHRFEHIVLGQPLMAGCEDEKKVARILADAYTSQCGEALLFVGHGTEHLAGTSFSAMQREFTAQGRNDVFVAVLKGTPTLEQIVPELCSRGYRQIHLVPLLLTAGRHTFHDLAGADSESWKSRLEAQGFIVRCTLQGLGRLPGIQQMYCNKCKEILG